MIAREQDAWEDLAPNILSSLPKKSINIGNEGKEGVSCASQKIRDLPSRQPKPPKLGCGQSQAPPQMMMSCVVTGPMLYSKTPTSIWMKRSVDTTPRDKPDKVFPPHRPSFWARLYELTSWSD